MSQHPSLRSSDKDKAQRSVLKRYERVKILKDKESWTENDSVYKLPKLKVVKFKVKKEKAAEAGAEGAQAVPETRDTTAPSSAVKGAAKPAAETSAKKAAK